MKYCAKIKKESDGKYLVTYPRLKTCFTEGNSLTHAKAMAKEALEGWLLSHIDIGKPIPKQPKHACKDCITLRVNLTVQ